MRLVHRLLYLGAARIISRELKSHYAGILRIMADSKNLWSGMSG